MRLPTPFTPLTRFDATQAQAPQPLPACGGARAYDSLPQEEMGSAWAMHSAGVLR